MEVSSNFGFTKFLVNLLAKLSALTLLLAGSATASSGAATFDFHKHRIEFWGDWLVKKYALYEQSLGDIKVSVTAGTTHNESPWLQIPHSDPTQVLVHRDISGLGALYKSDLAFNAPMIDEGGLDSYAGYTDRLEFNFTHAQTGKPISVRITSITFKLFEPIFGLDDANLYSADRDELIHVSEDQIGRELKFVALPAWGDDLHKTASWNFDTSLISKRLVITPGHQSSFKIYSMTVEPYNTAPEMISTPVTTAKENEPYRYQVAAIDEDNDELRFSLNRAPGGMQINAQTGLITWLPDFEQAGEHPLDIAVTDQEGNTTQQQFIITVSNTNRPPTITSIAPLTTAENRDYRYLLKASDPDGDKLAYALQQAPPGMNIDISSGLITWTPSFNQAGTHPIAIKVSDPLGGVKQQFVIKVANINRPPVVTNNPRLQTPEKLLYQHNIEATDPDNDSLRFVLSQAPTGMTINAETGQISWIPGRTDIGQHLVNVEVIDSGNLKVVQSFRLTVINVNDAPVINSTPVQSAVAGENYSYPVIATDEDGDPLRFVLQQAPDGMTIDSGSGVIQWAPELGQAAQHQVSVLVTDGNNASAEQDYLLNVTVPNNPPQVLSDPITVAVAGQAYQYTLNVVDEDSNPLNYQLTQAPNGMKLSNNTLQWQPVAADLGDREVSITIGDGITMVEHRFILKVIELDSSTPPYFGRDFWFADVFRASQGSNQLMVYITAKVDTQGVIESPSWLPAREPTTFSVKANQVTAIDIFRNGGVYGHDLILKKGLHVQADDDIAVYVLYNADQSTDAMSLMPTVLLGRKYRLSGYGQVQPGNGGYTVVAPQDNTTLTITPSIDLSRSAMGLGVVPAGSAYTVQLQRGEVYHVTGNTSKSPELTGTQVQSDQPVAVFINHSCSNVPYTDLYCDQLLEQLPPLHYWGQQYALVPHYSRYGDLVRVLADEDDTRLSVNGYVSKLLNAGEFWEFPLNEAQWLESNRPVLITQFATSDKYDQVLRRQDPNYGLNFNASVLNDRENFQSEYQVTIDSQSGSNGVIILAPQSATGRLLVDDRPVPASAFTGEYCISAACKTNGGPYALAQVALSAGDHVLSMDEPFGLYENVYGLNYFGDPYVSVVPPQELALDHYIFTTPEGSYARHFINLTVPTETLASIRLDGAPVAKDFFRTLPGGDLSYARLAINPGRHEIRAGQAFGLLVYGFDKHDSYGFIGGFGAPATSLPTQLNLSVSNLTPSAGEPLCIQAQLTDDIESPLNDVGVTFSLNGVHNTTENRFTGQDGVASYCFTGYTSGADEIRVSTTSLSRSLSILWQEPQGSNKAPVVTSAPVIYVETGVRYRYQVEARDPEQQTLSYRLLNAPEGMVMDSATGLVEWEVVAGDYLIEIEVRDGADNIAYQRYRLTANTPPLIHALPKQFYAIQARKSYISDFIVSDADGDVVTYELLEAPPFFNLLYRSGKLGATGDITGEHSIKARIRDSRGAVVDVAFMVTIVQNQKPILNNSTWEYSGYAGETLVFQVDASDPDGTALSYRFSTLRLNGRLTYANSIGLTLDPERGTVTWRPDASMTGTLKITVIVDDAWGGNSVGKFYLTAMDPGIGQSVEAIVATVDQSLSYRIATELSGEAEYRLIQAPEGVTLTSTGELQWRPTTADIGESLLVVMVTDEQGGYDYQEIPMQVRGDSNTPTITSTPPRKASASNRYLYLLAVDEPQAQPVSYSLIEAPNGMMITEQGLLDWTPLIEQLGWHTVSIRVSDADGNASVQRYQLEVTSAAYWNRQYCPSPEGQ